MYCSHVDSLSLPFSTLCVCVSLPVTHSHALSCTQFCFLCFSPLFSLLTCLPPPLYLRFASCASLLRFFPSLSLSNSAFPLLLPLASPLSAACFHPLRRPSSLYSRHDAPWCDGLCISTPFSSYDTSWHAQHAPSSNGRTTTTCKRLLFVFFLICFSDDHFCVFLIDWLIGSLLLLAVTTVLPLSVGCQPSSVCESRCGRSD